MLASFPTSFPNFLETVSGCYTLSKSSSGCKAALFEVCLRGDVGHVPNNPILGFYTSVFVLLSALPFLLPFPPPGLAWLSPVPCVVGALLGSLPCAGPLLVKLTLGLRVHCSSTSFSCGEGRPVTMVAQATSW